MIEVLGFTLAATAFFLSLGGSWLVSSKESHQRCTGFKLWLISNPFNIIVLCGVMCGIFNGLPLIFSVVIQVYFTLTAYRGFLSNKKEGDAHS